MPPPPETPENLTEKQLKFGYWFITHKFLLKRLAAVLLILLSASLYVFSLYYAIDYFFVRGVGERQALEELAQGVDYAKLHQARSPQELKFGSPLVFGGARDRYDLVVRVENRNKNFWASFNYKFRGAGFESLSAPGFLLPEDDKYLMQLAVPASSRPRSLRVEISNIRWQRISAHEISDPLSFTRDRVNFEIKDIKYEPAVAREKVIISRAAFTVTNNTAFSFWRVDFPVLLMRGATPQAVNIVTAEQFRSGETRTLEVSWFESIPPVERVEVKPSVNIFDEGAYIKN